MNILSTIAIIGLFLTSLDNTVHCEFFAPLKDEISNKILSIVPKEDESDLQHKIDTSEFSPKTVLNTAATMGQISISSIGGLSTFYLARILYGTVYKQYLRGKQPCGLVNEMFTTMQIGVLVSILFASDVGFGICSRVRNKTEKSDDSWLQSIKTKISDVVRK